jgi:hypothetical protein
LKIERDIFDMYPSSPVLTQSGTEKLKSYNPGYGSLTSIKTSVVVSRHGGGGAGGNGGAGGVGGGGGENSPTIQQFPVQYHSKSLVY